MAMQKYSTWNISLLENPDLVNKKRVRGRLPYSRIFGPSVFCLERRLGTVATLPDCLLLAGRQAKEDRIDPLRPRPDPIVVATVTLTTKTTVGTDSVLAITQIAKVRKNNHVLRVHVLMLILLVRLEENALWEARACRGWRLWLNQRLRRMCVILGNLSFTREAGFLRCRPGTDPMNVSACHRCERWLR